MGGEPEGGRLSSGSVVHGDAAMAEGKAVQPGSILVFEVSFEAGRPLHTHSSARLERRDVKKRVSTFLVHLRKKKQVILETVAQY